MTYFGLECNGLLAFPQAKMREFVDRTQEWSGGKINWYRHFLYMPPQWTGNMPGASAFYICSRPPGKKPTLHAPAYNKLINYIGYIDDKYPHVSIQFPLIDRCAWSIIKGDSWIYSDDTWNKYWKPLIREITEHFGMVNIIWEGCNESSAHHDWEYKLAHLIHEITTAQDICSSPMRNFNDILHNSYYDFLWAHGVWSPRKFTHDWIKYKNNEKVGFSSDGFSRLERWDWVPFDGMGMGFNQFNQPKYGKMAHPEHVRRCLMMMKKHNHHFAINMSGGYEVKRQGEHKPRWHYIKQICKIFKEIL